MAHQPIYIWVLVLSGVIGFPAVLAYGLFTGLVATGRSRRVAYLITGAFAVLWVTWIITSGLLAQAGAYRQSEEGRPWIGVAAGGAVLAVLAGTAIPAIRALAVPGTLARLTWAHAVRVVGVAFVLAMLLGTLPAVFALPAGLGDIAVGLTAPLIARRLARGDRTRATWFNVLGLLDLLVAVGIGFLAGLGPSRLPDVSPSTADVALLPLALIPTTAVPLAVALHVVTLIRLRTAPVRTPHPNAVPA